MLNKVWVISGRTFTVYQPLLPCKLDSSLKTLIQIPTTHAPNSWETFRRQTASVKKTKKKFVKRAAKSLATMLGHK